jgi:hypothetical protein
MRWKSALAISALTVAALSGTTANSQAAANSCANPVLATSLNGWGALDSGTVSRVAVNDVSGASWAFATTGRSLWMPQLSVSAGQRWTVAAQDRLVAGSGTAQLVVEWYSSAGTYLSESAGTATTLSTSTWKPVTASVVVPPGATGAHVLQQGSSAVRGIRSTLCSYQQDVASAPGAPTSVRATVNGTSATLTWAPPAATGGSAVTGYTYGRDGTDSQGTGPWSGNAAASARSATFNLLQPGSTYRLSVAATNAAGTGTSSSVTVTIPAVGGSPSGQAMPVGNLTGWRQVFTEDFTDDVALGSWPGSYSPKFDQYDYDWDAPDTNGGGIWKTSKDVSVSGGMADYWLHSEGTKAYSAAILPRTATQTYGRYQVRFKVDPGMSGWNSAWLLWPDDDVWPAHGEIDWPEGSLTGTMEGFMHYADPDGGQDWAPSNVAFASGWHTATTEWLPGSVKYYLDGALIGNFTTKIPNTPMHWVLQSESGSSSRPTGAGHIKIDWLTVYTRG